MVALSVIARLSRGGRIAVQVPYRTGGIVLLLVAVSAFAAGCGGSSSPSAQGGTPASGGSQQPSTWKVVALGDSDTTGKGDPTGLGWVERYARLLRQRVHGTKI